VSKAFLLQDFVESQAFRVQGLHVQSLSCPGLCHAQSFAMSGLVVSRGL
jgi:hypothetical protein